MTEPTSILSRLRDQREAGLAPKRSEVEVPGYSGMLAIRYRPIPWAEMTSLLSEAGYDEKAALKSNTKALGKACDAVLVREEGSTQTLGDVLRAQGETVHGEVGFDQYLVEALGLTVKVDTTGAVTFDEKAAVEERAPQGSHETVLALFAGAVSPELAIAEHAARLGAWMRGEGSLIDEELAGG